MLRWVQYSAEEREPLLGQLLCNLRIGLLSEVSSKGGVSCDEFIRSGKHQQHLGRADGQKTNQWNFSLVIDLSEMTARLTYRMISPEIQHLFSSVPKAKRMKLDPDNQKLLARLKNPKDQIQQDSVVSKCIWNLKVV